MWTHQIKDKMMNNIIAGFCNKKVEELTTVLWKSTKITHTLLYQGKKYWITKNSKFLLFFFLAFFFLNSSQALSHIMKQTNLCEIWMVKTISYWLHYTSTPNNYYWPYLTFKLKRFWMLERYILSRYHHN